MYKIISSFMVSFFVALAIYSTAIAQAPQPACKPKPIMDQLLLERYGESPMINAVTNQGAMMVMYSNQEKQTWTVVVVSAKDHKACLALAGEGFLLKDQIIPGTNS